MRTLTSPDLDKSKPKEEKKEPTRELSRMNSLKDKMSSFLFSKEPTSPVTQTITIAHNSSFSETSSLAQSAPSSPISLLSKAIEEERRIKAESPDFGGSPLTSSVSVSSFTMSRPRAIRVPTGNRGLCFYHRVGCVLICL